MNIKKLLFTNLTLLLLAIILFYLAFFYFGGTNQHRFWYLLFWIASTLLFITTTKIIIYNAPKFFKTKLRIMLFYSLVGFIGFFSSSPSGLIGIFGLPILVPSYIISVLVMLWTLLRRKKSLFY
jgi:hypothetical protein